MKFFIFLFVLTFPIFTIAQKEKSVHFLNENGYEISKELYKEEYRNRKYNISYLSITFENDTSYFIKPVKRKNYGRLSDNQFEKLKSFIYNIKLDMTYQNKYSIIKYHPGRDRCNGGRVKYNGNKNHALGKKYIQKLQKSFNIETFWIHKKDTTVNFKNSGWINWQVDKQQIIEDLFFKYHYPCGSFVVINNETKNYISIFGEYGASTVEETVEEMIKKS